MSSVLTFGIRVLVLAATLSACADAHSSDNGASDSAASCAVTFTRADQLPELPATCLLGYAALGAETDVELFQLNNAFADGGWVGETHRFLFKLGGDSDFPRTYHVVPETEDGIAPSDEAWIRYEPGAANHRFVGVSGSVVISHADTSRGLFGTFQFALQEEDGYYSGRLIGAPLEVRGALKGLRFCPDLRDSDCGTFVIPAH